MIAHNSKETGEIFRISPRKSARGIRPGMRSATFETGLSLVHISKFPLTCFVALIREILLNIYLTSSRPPFACQNHISISQYTCQVSLLGSRTHESKFSFTRCSKIWHDYSFETTIGSFARKNCQVFSGTNQRKKLVTTKSPLDCTRA